MQIDSKYSPNRAVAMVSQVVVVACGRSILYIVLPVSVATQLSKVPVTQGPGQLLDLFV